MYCSGEQDNRCAVPSEEIRLGHLNLDCITKRVCSGALASGLAWP
jgi:hypothetical protein